MASKPANPRNKVVIPAAADCGDVIDAVSAYATATKHSTEPLAAWALAFAEASACPQGHEDEYHLGAIGARINEERSMTIAAMGRHLRGLIQSPADLGAFVAGLRGDA